jgi:hypothetical protein
MIAVAVLLVLLVSVVLRGVLVLVVRLVLVGDTVVLVNDTVKLLPVKVLLSVAVLAVALLLDSVAVVSVVVEAWPRRTAARIAGNHLQVSGRNLTYLAMTTDGNSALTGVLLSLLPTKVPLI